MLRVPEAMELQREVVGKQPPILNQSGILEPSDDDQGPISGGLTLSCPCWPISKNIIVSGDSAELSETGAKQGDYGRKYLEKVVI